MSLPIYVFLIAAQAVQTGQPAQTPTTVPQTAVTAPAPPVVVTPQAMLSTPFVVAEPNRLAITPVIDGKLDDEEWDPLGPTADGSKTYFEWEPGKLHFAAVVPNGHDALVSIDLDNNGWMRGKDNLEIRLTQVAGKAAANIRILDATNVNGPTWRTLPGLSVAANVASSADATNTTYELTLSDPGLAILPGDNGDSVALRIDDPLSTDAPIEPFFPRVLTPVVLSYSRSAGLPAGIHFAPEGEGRAYVAGERGRVRLTFNGSDAAKLQRLELHTEGPAKNDTNMLAVPFPKFDNKGRSYVDYETGIRDTASIGFRVLHGVLTAGDGVSAILEASYRVAPPIDITVVTQPVGLADKDRSIRFAFYIHSNSMRSLKGDVSVSAPLPFKLVNTDARDFDVATARGRLRETFELYVPAGTAGTYPIHFTGEVKGQKFDQVAYITIGGV